MHVDTARRDRRERLRKTTGPVAFPQLSDQRSQPLGAASENGEPGRERALFVVLRIEQRLEATRLLAKSASDATLEARIGAQLPGELPARSVQQCPLALVIESKVPQ